MQKCLMIDETKIAAALKETKIVAKGKMKLALVVSPGNPARSIENVEVVTKTSNELNKSCHLNYGGHHVTVFYEKN